ncbi:MAG TPA: FtsX-like permease family protein [Acidobacteriaceae bacterium]
MNAPAKRTTGRALSSSVALRIAWREFEAAPAKFIFVIVSVAIGVAALTGVRGFTESFQKTLLGQARTIMAADVSARMFRQPSAKEIAGLNALQGVERTQVTEMVSMASTPSDPIPLLVSLKAVDPSQYPFYGAYKLRPAGTLREELSPERVLVGEDLLIRLHAQIGDSLKLGNSTFRIAGVIEREPDRMNSSMGIGPRVLITRQGLAESGLLQPGSRAGERFLMRLQPGASDIKGLHAQVEKVLPEAQVTDFREANPALTRGLDRASSMLSLICLVAMVLGAIGVAMSMRAHLEQRMDILATMKSIGARSSDILRIYLLQTLLLGLAGGLVGVVAGFGVEWTIPLLAAKLLPIEPSLRLPVRAGLAGLGTGMLTTLLFCLPPLLDIRRIKPNLVLRRQVETQPEFTLAERWQRRRMQWIATAVILIALAGIAAGLTNSLTIAAWFTAALVALLLFITLLARTLLRMLRTALARTRLSLPSAVRHGLSNLYRPGNQSTAVLTALGAGIMLILTVFLMQNAVLRDLQETLGKGLPNIFLIDIATDELDGVASLIAKKPGVHGAMERLPVVAGRLNEVNGTSGDALKQERVPRHLLQSVSLTWSDTLPAGAKVHAGAWWKPGDEGKVAVSEGLARRMHVGVGSTMLFTVQEQRIPVTVSALYANDGQHVFGRSEFILSQRSLAHFPVVWYGAVHLDTAQIPQMQRALFAAYPTVTVINIADLLDTVAGVVHQVTIIVRFLAAFSILSGLVILASSVASTRFRRIREVVVLKTLGARRARVAAVFGVEFTVLGLLAGCVGVIFANLLTFILLHRLDVTFHLQWPAAAAAAAGTALLAVITGWLVSIRILGQRPLEVLREE